MPLPIPVLPTLDPTALVDGEETLVADGRGALSPSQQVEQRVIRLLANSPALVSQFHRQLNRGAR